MDNKKIIDSMVAEYQKDLLLYDGMKRYYDGDHDILSDYNKFDNRSNQIVIDNYINKFINEEVQYSLGNTLSFVSKSGDVKIINAIYNNLFHWNDNHNQELMRQLEIYGTAFLLNYVDQKGRFCERILTPHNAICYCDDDGVPVRFIHFYEKKYDDSKYMDVYYPDGTIESYKNNSIVKKTKHVFMGIPVSVCKMKNINDTIYAKIKSLQDSYNTILSDQCNTISDYRNAYLVISGVAIDENTKNDLKKHGLLNLPSVNNTSAKWLVKDMPDTYIQNTLDNLRDAMYSNTNHIDGNEKLQSNTSGTALRNRLVFLEQRCNMVLDIVLNSVYERLERLFEYLDIKGTKYNITDVKVIANPCIPQDVISIIQALSQLGIGSNISLETALGQVPFIENPLQEIEKIKAEKKNNEAIELDKAGLDDGE